MQRERTEQEKMLPDYELADRDLKGAAPKALPDAIEVPLWVFLGMLVTEMRKHAGDKDATLALANTVQEIANAIRK
jgi:hypothetical protein